MIFPYKPWEDNCTASKKKKEEEINLDPYHTTYEVKPKMCPRPKSKAWNSKTHNLKENIYQIKSLQLSVTQLFLK